MRLDADEFREDGTRELILKVIDKLDSFELEDETRAFVGETFEAFIAYRATLHAIHEAQEYVDDDDLDSAVRVVQKSQRVRLAPDDDGIRVVADMATYFDIFNNENLKHVSVATGLKPLDQLIGGGIRPGELGVWLAPTGFGKSMALVHCGAAAVRKRKQVVHFTFENSDTETFARYVYNLLQVDSKELTKWGAADDRFVERYAALRSVREGDAHVYKRAGTETTANDLRLAIDRLRDGGVDVGLVIVDYGDCMRPARLTMSKYDDQQSVFEELRDLAALTDLPVWTATQGNRRALIANRVRLDHVADSIGKAMVADIIVSIGKPTDDTAQRVVTRANVPDADEDDDDTRERLLTLLKLRRGEHGLAVKVQEHFKQARFEVVEDEWEQ
jgi:hypothetical protein